jgi:hypothetical protein
MAARRKVPDYDPANPTDRALARQKGSFAVCDKAELAALIRVAGSAALRLHISTKDPEVQEIQDILFALSGALARGDSKLRKALHGPALRDLAERQIAEEKAVLEGKPPDLSVHLHEAHLRSHGSKQRIADHVMNVASLFGKGSDAAHFADFVSLLVLRGPYEHLDQATVRRKLEKTFKGGPSGDPEEDAVRILTVLCGNAKDARNMVSAPKDMRLRRAHSQLEPKTRRS